MKGDTDTRHAAMTLGWRLPLLLVLLALLPPRAAALDELPLKAAIIYNLLLFVQWPGEDAWPPGATLVLCAAPAGRLWPHLHELQGRPVRQWRLAVREAEPGAAAGCHAWLLEDAPPRGPLARGAAAWPGLTIADGSRADDPGVVIGLRVLDNRLGFDVGLGAARAQGLQLSSKMLRLARVVRE